MATYFSQFQEALDPTEPAAQELTKAIDPGGDILPFAHLEDRRFEILVYRLKYVELENAGARVTLMQGVGERGRDVVVCSASGALSQVIQCKNYDSRLTLPAVRKELLKLAIHHHLEPSILGNGPVSYELWCPGGLTEPAAKFLDTWPLGWNAQALESDALEVIESFVAFKNVKWAAVGQQVLDSFSAVATPRPINGVDISARARKCLPIYEAFFQAKIVMDRNDVMDAVRQAVAEATGFAKLTDEDAKHILDRIAAFPSAERLVHTSGYVMGLKPELVSRFKRGEYQAFVTHALQGTSGLIQVVIGVCGRLANEAIKEFREDIRPNNKSLTHVFLKTLNTSMVSRVNGMIMSGLKLQPGLEAYEALSLHERLAQDTREAWEDYQRCIAGYDPVQHAPGSDEEYRSRIAKHAIDGAASLADFEKRLMSAVEEHRIEIETRFERYMSLVPKEILLVADTKTIFDSDWLFGRMTETVALLQRLRGSAIVPE